MLVLEVIHVALSINSRCTWHLVGKASMLERYSVITFTNLSSSFYLMCIHIFDNLKSWSPPSVDIP